MEDRLIIGIDLSKEESETTCTLIVARPIEKHALQILNEFHGKEAEEIYKLLVDQNKLKDIKTRNTMFDCIDIYNNAYENANKKVLEEFMLYTFFNNEEKVVVLDKEKIKRKYKVQDVIFEEEDKYYE